MSCRYWIGTLCLVLLMIDGINGKCYVRGKLHVSTYERTILECSDVDQEEFQKYIDSNGTDVNELIIRNSTIPFDEILPFYPKMKVDWLTITNANLTTLVSIDPGLAYLDLSFNNIKELGDVISLSYKVILHHNQIEFLNGSQIVDSSPLAFLDLSHNIIKNFTKLEKKRLVSLNLSHNLIEEIGDLLSYLNEIQIIDLSYNKLKEISADDFGNLKILKSLNLSHNDIVSIKYDPQTFPTDKSIFWELYNNFRYQEIVDLSFNDIKQLPNGIFRGCLSTKTINLENNGLEDLKFLISKESKQIKGDSLVFSNNKIKTLYPYTFSGFILWTIDLSSNEIESILPLSFDGLWLENLCLAKNKLTSLNSSSFSGSLHLKKLNLSFNPLTVIDGTVLSQLQVGSLDLSNCLLTKVPGGIYESTFLSEMFLSNNRIDSLEPHSFPTLSVLDLSHNELKTLKKNVFSDLVIKGSLNLAGNPIESLEDVFNNTKIKALNLSGISLSKLSYKDMRGLIISEGLDLSNSGIEELGNNTFDQMPSLETLSLDYNSIRILPSNFFCFNGNLKSLSMLRNPISNIQPDAFPHIMRLENLTLSINGEISEKRLINLIFLEELHFLHSTIPKINENSFKGLGHLKKLNFENSTVLNVEPGAFKGLRNVREIDEEILFANITKLRSKTFMGLEGLESLNFSGIGIKNIEDGAFEGLVGLVNLNLSHNKIRSLSLDAFMGLKKLRILDLSFNGLTNEKFLTGRSINGRVYSYGPVFPTGIFRDSVNLTHLHLEYNIIFHFETGAFSNLQNLRFLNLSHNYLTSLSEPFLFQFRNLQVLDINSNNLRKIHYNDSKTISPSEKKLIGIGGNKLPCDELTRMLRCFEYQNIVYHEISKLDFEVPNIRGILCVEGNDDNAHVAGQY